MFIRDPWTALTWQQSGNPVMLAGAAPAESDQVLMRRLHGLALSIYQGQQDVNAAQARHDVPYVQARLVDLGNMRTLFSTTATQFQGNDAEAIGAFTQFANGVRDWEDQVAAWVRAGGISNAVAFIPNTVIDALTKIGVKAGVGLFAISLPVVAIGGLLLWFLLKAEKSRTVRGLTSSTPVGRTVRRVRATKGLTR